MLALKIKHFVKTKTQQTKESILLFKTFVAKLYNLTIGFVVTTHAFILSLSPLICMFIGLTISKPLVFDRLMREVLVSEPIIIIPVVSGSPIFRIPLQLEILCGRNLATREIIGCRQWSISHPHNVIS